jgi:hypothetical protein
MDAALSILSAVVGVAAAVAGLVAAISVAAAGATTAAVAAASATIAYWGGVALWFLLSSVATSVMHAFVAWAQYKDCLANADRLCGPGHLGECDVYSREVRLASIPALLAWTGALAGWAAGGMLFVTANTSAAQAQGGVWLALLGLLRLIPVLGPGTQRSQCVCHSLDRYMAAKWG